MEMVVHGRGMWPIAHQVWAGARRTDLHVVHGASGGHGAALIREGLAVPVPW